MYRRSHGRVQGDGAQSRQEAGQLHGPFSRPRCGDRQHPTARSRRAVRSRCVAASRSHRGRWGRARSASYLKAPSRPKRDWSLTRSLPSRGSSSSRTAIVGSVPPSPASTVRTSVTVKNTGNVPLSARLSSTESWLSADLAAWNWRPGEIDRWYDLEPRIASAPIPAREAKVQAACRRRGVGNDRAVTCCRTRNSIGRNPVRPGEPAGSSSVRGRDRAEHRTRAGRLHARRRRPVAPGPAEAAMVNHAAGVPPEEGAARIITPARRPPKLPNFGAASSTGAGGARCPVIRNREGAQTGAPPDPRAAALVACDPGPARLSLQALRRSPTTATAGSSAPRPPTSRGCRSSHPDLPLGRARTGNCGTSSIFPYSRAANTSATITISSRMGAPSRCRSRFTILDPNPVLEVLPAPNLGTVSPELPLSAFVQVRNGGVGLLTRPGRERDTARDRRAGVRRGGAHGRPPVRFQLDDPGGRVGGRRVRERRCVFDEQRRFPGWRSSGSVSPVEQIRSARGRSTWATDAAGRSSSDRAPRSACANTGPDRVRARSRRVAPVGQAGHRARSRSNPGEAVSGSVPRGPGFRRVGPVESTDSDRGALGAVRRRGARAPARKVVLLVVPSVVVLGRRDTRLGAKRSR